MCFYLFRRCLLALSLAVTLGSGMVVAQERSPLVSLDSSEQQAELESEQRELEQATQLPRLQMTLPSGRASSSLLTMYSSQQGSWPFEPFVHNGLFRAIAGYQNNHPRALVLRGGSITLQQLYSQLGDQRIISRHKDGYLLRYPLMIEPGAALLVQNTALYLYGTSGTALINRGLLSLNNAKLQSYNPGRQETDRPYRPFLINWAGSKLSIEASSLTGLGYNENLSRGISSARSVHQPGAAPPAQVLVSNSEFTDMSSGLELDYAQASISDSYFIGMQQYAMDLRNSRVQVERNRIDGVQNLSGIRLAAASIGRVEGNRILHVNKSALEVNALSGNLLIRGNQLGASAGYGIMLREVSTQSRLLIANNLIGNTELSAIDGANLHQLSVVGNRITGTPEYAISLRNSRATDGPLIVTGNHLWGVGKAMLRVQGIHYVVLGDNRYQGNPLLQNMLIGDLLPYQTPVLRATLGGGRIVGVRMARVSLLPIEG